VVSVSWRGLDEAGREVTVTISGRSLAAIERERRAVAAKLAVLIPTSRSPSAEDRLAAAVRSTSVPRRLSPREGEVVRLVLRGLSDKDIAASLDVSAYTVAAHVKHAYRKLDVHSRAELGAAQVGTTSTEAS